MHNIDIVFRFEACALGQGRLKHQVGQRRVDNTCFGVHTCFSKC